MLRASYSVTVDNYSKTIEVEGAEPMVHFVDTTGQEDREGDRSRRLGYFDVGVFIICFSIGCPESLRNVVVRWAPEVKNHGNDVPFILVGNDSDLRDDEEKIKELDERGVEPVTIREGQATSLLIGAYCYVETSTRIMENIDHVFEEAVRCAQSYHLLNLIVGAKNLNNVYTRLLGFWT